jgi:uncharacterized protein
MIICDTSALIRLVDGSHADHKSVRQVVGSRSGSFVVSPFVLAEFDYMLGRHKARDVVRNAIRAVTTGKFRVAQLSQAEIEAALDVDEQFNDLALGLTDASLVVLAYRHRTNALLTYDEKHFRAITPLQGGSFHILPVDGS